MPSIVNMAQILWVGAHRPQRWTTIIITHEHSIKSPSGATSLYPKISEALRLHQKSFFVQLMERISV